MEFKDFAPKLKKIIGSGNSTHIFTKTIFETMMNESGPELIADKSPSTFKSYYNGHSGISTIASIVIANLSDEDGFSTYLDEFGDTTAQLLADEFMDSIPDITAVNAPHKISDLFLEILRNAAEKKKSTPKSANGLIKIDSTDTENLLDYGNGTFYEIILPGECPPDNIHYSTEDNLLLEEFNGDYDAISLTLVSENYTSAFIDMTLPYRIKDLYESKWVSKANDFQDPNLKSHVYGFLGELNKISESLILGSSTTITSIRSRLKIRNLIIKLHPEKYDILVPFDALIDDWDNGEF